MFNLRTKGVVEDFDWKKVHYMSVHFLDSAENATYGKNRVLRDLLDAWCEKKMSFAGIQFRDDDVKLSEEELAAIPGSEIVKSVDALKLEVTVRNGSSVEVHPDQIRQWRSAGGMYTEEFDKLVANHDQHFKNMLAGVVESGGGNADAPVLDRVAETPESNDPPPPSLQEFESVEKLQEADPIKFKAMSEVPEVELLRGKSGSTYIVATKRNRDIPRHTILAGFGTGKFFGF